MASAKSLDEEALLGTLTPPPPPPGASHKAASRRRWIPILPIAGMLALITYCALLSNAVPGLAAPWKNDKHVKDTLNPYADGRRLSTQKGKFKIALFSDLHYGERGANNSWVDWADEAVSRQP